MKISTPNHTSLDSSQFSGVLSSPKFQAFQKISEQYFLQKIGTSNEQPSGKICNPKTDLNNPETAHLKIFDKLSDALDGNTREPKL